MNTRLTQELHAHPRGNNIKPWRGFSLPGAHGHREGWPVFLGLAWPPGSRGAAGVPRSLQWVPRSRLLGDFAAAPGTALGWALGQPRGLAFAQAAPLVQRASGDGVGAAVHHPGVQAVGHGEGLEVAPQGQGQRELVHQVHGGAGHHRPAAQVLQAQHLGKKRNRAQAVPAADLRAARPTYPPPSPG